MNDKPQSKTDSVQQFIEAEILRLGDAVAGNDDEITVETYRLPDGSNLLVLRVKGERVVTVTVAQAVNHALPPAEGERPYDLKVLAQMDEDRIAVARQREMFARYQAEHPELINPDGSMAPSRPATPVDEQGKSV